MKDFNFDYEITKSFIPEEDKKRFICFENVYLHYDGSKIIAHSDRLIDSFSENGAL